MISPDHFRSDVENYFTQLVSWFLGVPAEAKYERTSFMDRRITVTATGGFFMQYTFVSLPDSPATLKTVLPLFREALQAEQVGVH